MCLLITLIIAHLITEFCLSFNIETLSYNDSLYINIESVNISTSYDTIKYLPIKYYFDVNKGQYKHGLLVNDLVNNTTNLSIDFNEYINIVDKKYIKEGKVIDTNRLFMHIIGAIQLLDHQIEINYNKTNNLLINKTNKTNYILNYLYGYLNNYKSINNLSIDLSNYQSIKQIKLEQDIINKQLDIVNTQIDYYLNKSIYLSNLTNYIIDNKKTNRLINYNKTINQLITKYNTSYIYSNYSKQSLEILNQSLNSLYNHEVNILIYELNNTIDSYLNEYEIYKITLEYKINEEIRINEQLNQLNDKLLVIKYTNYISNYYTVISILIQELSVLRDKLLIPKILFFQLIIYLSIYLLILLYGLIVRYLNRSNKKYVLVSNHSSNDRFIIQSTNQTNKFTIRNNKNIYNYISNDLNVQIIRYILELYNNNNNIYLSNILITSNNQTGLGKTYLLNLLSLCIHKSTIQLSIYDIKNLKSIISDNLNNKPFVILIDDIDEAIVNRDRYINNDLYILLDIMKNLSTNYCFIITTSISLDLIDSALLDRIDKIIELTVPNVIEKLDCMLCNIKDFLYVYLPINDKELLDQLIFESKNQKYNEILTNIVNISNYQNNHQNNYLSNYISNEFNLQPCIEIAIYMSNDWNYRDINKFISGINTEILGSDSCVLTNDLWLKELRRSLE